MYQMMKRWIAAALAAVCAFSMAACGGKSGGKEPAAVDVVQAVAQGLTFKDTMMTVDQDVFYNFYDIDAQKVADVSMYTSSSRATAEEVTVIRMKDAADIQLAQDAIAARIEDQKRSYESYMPDEMPKINNAAVYTHGSYAILVVADDTSGAEKTFEAQF